MTQGRIKAFDWLRGIAVLVMVQTHAVVLLRPELRAQNAFHWVDFVDGLVAPSFLFAAGFSLSLVQVRAAVSAASRKGRFTQSLQRVGEVLLVATLMNALWFPVLQQAHWLYRLDILHCLGLGLLLALPIVWVLARRPLLIAVALGTLATLAFFASPFTEAITGWPARFFNEASGSTFPVLPWCAYLFLGAAVGAFVASGRKKLALAVVATAGLGFLLWKLTPWMSSLYPKHTVWRTGPGPHGLRFMYVCLGALGLMAVEQWLGTPFGRARKVRETSGLMAVEQWLRTAFGGARKVIETFGQNSLAAYVFHLLFLFYEPIGGASFRAQWLGSLDFVQLGVASVGLIALTYGALQALLILQRRVEAAAPEASEAGGEKRIGRLTSPREAPFYAARSDQ